MSASPSPSPSPIPADPQARVIFEQIQQWPIYDPHSHINPHSPAARNLDEVLGYHYYTELAHSAGMPAAEVDLGLEPRERARNLANYLDRFENTIQHSWLVEIARTFHGFEGDRIGPDTIDALYDKAEHGEDGSAWDEEVWRTTRLEAVFLTNDFDDPLEGFDTARFVPCLRTDDLVLKLHCPGTLDRLRTFTETDVHDVASLREAIGKVFDHFRAKSARACAISLPPDFAPRPIETARAEASVAAALRGRQLTVDEQRDLSAKVFWIIAENCAEFGFPFDLMIGPIRNIYPQGVEGGRDLFDRRVSLADYRELFNYYGSVTFPISTLSPDAGPELVAYAWIFPNVVTSGHWWYSNVPPFIAADLKARLAAVPQTKQVAYYSDAYKLEFVLPKFRMYQRVLSECLAEDFVRGRGWSESRAIDLARTLLLENPRRIFRPTEIR